MFYVYIIESKVDSSYYIGYTSDIKNRLLKHNTANTGYTSRKQPWLLKYYEEFENKKDAIKREKHLKRQRNKEFYNKLIRNWSGSSVG
jgi:putative endonuclease